MVKLGEEHTGSLLLSVTILAIYIMTVAHLQPEFRWRAKEIIKTSTICPNNAKMSFYSLKSKKTYRKCIREIYT